MQHFVSFNLSQANFIRLSDKNINAARNLTVNNLNRQKIDPNSFTQLSGIKPSANTGLDRHDALQHTPITKKHYKTLTGNNPNQYFPEGSLARSGAMDKTTMPLAPNVPEKVNSAIELMADTLSEPQKRAYVRFTETVPRNITPDVVHSYIKRKNTQPERLSAMLATDGTTIENASNQEVREAFIRRMKSAPNRPAPHKPELPPKPSLYDKYQARDSFTDNYPKYNGVKYDDWAARQLTGGLEAGLTPLPPKTQNKLRQISNRRYEEQRNVR